VLPLCSVKLPLYVVFKCSAKPSGRVYKELKKGEGYTEECMYITQDKAWFDEQVMLDWIERVWSKLIEDRGGKLTYLLLDEFAVHVTSKVLEALVKLSTEVDIIPAGYTSKLQPLDVGLNKPFKAYCRQSFERWLHSRVDGAKPHRRDAAVWAASAWNRITVRTICKTWNHIGYTSQRIPDNDNGDVSFEMEAMIGTDIADEDIVLSSSDNDNNEDSTNGTDDDGTKFWDDDDDIEVEYEEDNNIEHEGTQETEVLLLSSDDPPQDCSPGMKKPVVEITTDLGFLDDDDSTVVQSKFKVDKNDDDSSTLEDVSFETMDNTFDRKRMIEELRKRNSNNFLNDSSSSDDINEKFSVSFVENKLNKDTNFYTHYICNNDDDNDNE
jgi:DDE superfamily endonuclease